MTIFWRQRLSRRKKKAAPRTRIQVLHPEQARGRESEGIGSILLKVYPHRGGTSNLSTPMAAVCASQGDPHNSPNCLRHVSASALEGTAACWVSVITTVWNRRVARGVPSG